MGLRLFICFSILAISPVYVLAQAEVDWRALTLDGENRALAFFPLTFHELLDTAETAMGRIPTRTYYARDLSGVTGNRLYSLMLYDYPSGSFSADSTDRLDEFFSATIEAASLAVAGDVKFSASTERKYPGRVFRVDFGEQGNISRNYVYVIGDRYYHQQVVSAKQDQGTKSRERFFQSFSPLTPREEP